MLMAFSQDFYNRDSFDEIIKMRVSNQPYANFKTACFVKYLGYLLMHFQDFYNRDSFDETIEMRGNNPMLTSKLHVLLNILATC